MGFPGEVCVEGRKEDRGISLLLLLVLFGSISVGWKCFRIWIF